MDLSIKPGATTAEILAAVREQATIDTVHAILVGGMPKLDEVTETREYNITPIALPKEWITSEYGFRITRVRVSRTRFVGSGEPDYVHVQGYGRPLTKAGKPQQRTAPVWRYLPDELADQLAPIS